MRYWWNFVGFISTMPSCAYRNSVSVRWFLAELWDFEIFALKILSSWFLHTLGLILMKLCRNNKYLSCCAYCKPVLVWWNFVFAISLKPLVWFWWNFVGMISAMPCCAYLKPVPNRWFLAELWDFEIFSLKTLSALFLQNPWLDFDDTLWDWWYHV